MGILKVVEWNDNTRDTIVYKVDLRKNNINKGSMLTVRDSQVAIFADKGRMADVFLPGSYKLDTNSIPLITTLLSWKYGFEHPFKSDIYFVNTKQFTNQKWGTSNPILLKDADYGPVRIRGFGTYSFRVKDAFVFMKELSGTGSSYKTEDISEYIKSMVVTNITDAIGEANLPVLEMASNLVELGNQVKASLSDTLARIGIEIVQFNFENFSLPDNLQAILDEQMRLNVMGKNIDTYSRLAQADALKDAAKNPGMAGSTMGAGMGIGLGAAMGNMFSSSMNNQQGQQKNDEHFVTCKKCGAKAKERTKFCPECGAPLGNICPNCKASVKEGAKFCPECGYALVKKCKKCGADLQPGAKFCPECGEKQ